MSSSTANATTNPARTSPSARGVATAIGIGAVGSVVVNSLIAAVARGPLDVSDKFTPLTPGAFIFWSILGTVIGAIGWLLIQRKTAQPDRVLRVLVPTVLVLSLVPDVLIWVDDSMAGISSTAVLALMAMHVATAAVLVTVFRRFIR